MDIKINNTFLPQNDPEAAIGFYRDVLGFEVRLDVGKGEMRWITVGPEGQPDVAIVLEGTPADDSLVEDLVCPRVGAMAEIARERRITKQGLKRVAQSATISWRCQP